MLISQLMEENVRGSQSGRRRRGAAEAAFEVNHSAVICDLMDQLSGIFFVDDGCVCVLGLTRLK